MRIKVLKRFAHKQYYSIQTMSDKIIILDGAAFKKMTREFVFHNNIHTIYKFTIHTNICFSIVFFLNI